MDNTSFILVALSLTVSVCTILFTALSMGWQRSHNIKSVKPFCNIHQCSTQSEISIAIQNAGLGPMIIRNIVLLKSNDDPFDNGVFITQIISFDPTCSSMLYQADTYVLASMCKVKLFCYTADSSGSNEISDLKKALHGLTICIRYQDIYDHCYEKKEALVF